MIRININRRKSEKKEEKTMETVFTFLLILAVIFVLLRTLLKGMFKAFFLFAGFVLVVVAVYFMFNIGFVWSSDEVNERLHTDKWIAENSQDDVTSWLKHFENKRTETGQIIDTEKVGQLMEESKMEAQEKWNEADKEAMREKWLEFFSSLTSDEAKEAASQTKDIWKGFLTEKEVNESIS